MSPTSRTTTFRRRFGAVSLLLAAVLFSAAELLFPTEGEDPAGELATDAAHHGRLLAAIFIYLAASILFIPAFFALMNPVRRRGTVLTHLGGGMALLGTALGGIALTGLQLIMYEASSPGVDRASLVSFIQHSQKDVALAPLPMGHYLFAFGILLLAVGLFRSRTGYRWAAICLGLAPLLDMTVGSMADGIVVSVVSDALLIAGAAGYAWWQATTSNAAWQGDVPEPAAIGAAQTVAA